MNLNEIVAAISDEIERLTAARDALTAHSDSQRRTRTGSKRVWSTAARARQARVMKARWAARKKAAKKK